MRYKISVKINNRLLKNSLRIFFLRYLEDTFFLPCKLLESYRNVYRKSSVKRECHDENVSLKADRALRKLNFLFHLQSKNLVTLWKFNSHLQYCKIDLTFSIKLQEIYVYFWVINNSIYKLSNKSLILLKWRKSMNCTELKIIYCLYMENTKL